MRKDKEVHEKKRQLMISLEWHKDQESTEISLKCKDSCDNNNRNKNNDNKEDKRGQNEQCEIKKDCNLFVSNHTFKFDYGLVDMKVEHKDEVYIGGLLVSCNDELNKMIRKRLMLILALTVYNDTLWEPDPKRMNKFKINEAQYHKSDEWIRLRISIYEAGDVETTILICEECKLLFRKHDEFYCCINSLAGFQKNNGTGLFFLVVCDLVPWENLKADV